MFTRWTAAAIGLALVAAACSADSTPLTVEEYATALQEVESDFDSTSTDLSDPESNRDEYPLGGDLVAANGLYMEYEERLDGWRAISPPPELSELHVQLVAALDAVQEEVGDYLGENAMAGNEFDFDSIGPAVQPFLRDAAAACRELRAALEGADAGVVFADSCNF